MGGPTTRNRSYYGQLFLRQLGISCSIEGDWIVARLIGSDLPG
jgi:hypothetical protein